MSTCKNMRTACTMSHAPRFPQGLPSAAAFALRGLPTDATLAANRLYRARNSPIRQRNYSGNSSKYHRESRADCHGTAQGSTPEMLWLQATETPSSKSGLEPLTAEKSHNKNSCMWHSMQHILSNKSYTAYRSSYHMQSSPSSSRWRKAGMGRKWNDIDELPSCESYSATKI